MRQSHAEAKTSKLDEAYVALGFPVTTVGDKERPVCLLCRQMLAADSMKPNKWRRHLSCTQITPISRLSRLFLIFHRKSAEHCQQ